MCQIQYNVETDSYIVMGRSTGYRMAMGHPVVDDIIDMEKIQDGSILTDLLEKFRQIDDKYAGKVRQIIMPNQPDGSMMSVARSGMGAVLGAPITHGVATPDVDKLVNPGMYRAQQAAAYGVPVASAAFRYGLPLAAAAGVADLTGRVYDAASDVEVFQ